MKTAGLVLTLLAIVGLLAFSADAYTVAGVGKLGFADFSKAIVFTGAACPTNSETVQTNTGAKNCALTMRPVGDGSWVCTGVVFPGTTYQYYFEYRIPAYEDTNGWRNAGAGGARNQDPGKDMTVPANAAEGFVFYHIYGDKTVRGETGIAKTGTWDTELTNANPYVARYRGTVDVDNTGDNDTANLEAGNNFGMTVVQTGDTKVRISWDFDPNGDDICPTVEGGREFDTTSTATPYGFKILRARLAATWKTDTTNPNLLKFEDTVVNQVTGDELYSPSKSTLGISWYSALQFFDDTSMPSSTAVGDTYIYTVLWRDAYGNQNDTSDQNFSGGADDFTRKAGIETLFLVERFDPNVVFPNGATEGTIYLTPYVNGVPNPFRTIKTKAYIARRAS